MATLSTTERQRRWATRVLLVGLVALGTTVLTQEGILRLGIVDRIELATLDYRFAARGAIRTPEDSSNVVIVEISTDSFRSIPERYPWPRSHYAHLLRNLRQAGARVVAFDLLFSDPDGLAPQHDSAFAAAIRETGIAVLAGKREEDNPLYVQTKALLDFGTIFFSADSSVGLVNLRPDVDGVYRLYNTAYLMDTSAAGGVYVPSLAFAALNKYYGFLPFTTPVPGDRSFSYAGRSFPAYDAGSILVNFYGPDGTFPHLKFEDVIDDSSFTTVEETSTGEQVNTFTDPDFGYLHDGTFRGKIVLVGVTVPEYKDLFPVSIARGQLRGDNLMYGVEIHANVIENVLRNDFLQGQPFLSQVLMILGLTIFSFTASSAIKAWKTRHHSLVEAAGFLFVALLLLGIGVLAVQLFLRFNYVLALTPALVAILGGYISSTVYHFITERKQRLLIKSMFSTYVNPAVVDELVANPERLVLGGRREELTVLFSDIEGFTTFSQKMEPERLVALLNEYLSVMSDVVFRNKGTLDKYEGDAIMAFWGAPIPQEDHPLLACRTALQMKDQLAALNAEWLQQGKPHLNIRIGINTGTMVVGNMGSAGKFAYTVIGDSVNLASRLEGANKEYRTTIMVSERTYGFVRDAILARKLDKITVKGRSEPVTTYELLQELKGMVDDETRRFLAAYEEGLERYYGRDWEGAIRSFERALALRPGDGPSALHRSRSLAYAAVPPPDNWDGVFVMTTK
jgi:adenylate cyclase